MTFLASSFTWFNLLPGYNNLEAALSANFGNSLMSGDPVHTITHLSLSLVSCAVILLLVMLTRASWSRSSNPAIPEAGFGARNFLEMITDTCIGLAEPIFGNRKQTERFLPLIGALAIYIFFANVMALVPGMAPPTDNLNVTIGPALVVFFATHFYGLKDHGLSYLIHFLGPKIGGLYLLAPLFIPIELISHLARPLSLALRLFGNMFGDHQVLAIFLGLAAFPLVFPIPVMLLGTVVVIVQTLVFSLLTIVYVSMAVETSEEAH